MTVLSLVSFAGAPGVTTTAVAAVAALDGAGVPEPVLIELATSGGVVAGFHDLPPEPGLTSLALDLGGAGPDLMAHAQELPGGVVVVPAPPSGSKTAKLLEARSVPLADYLRDVPATVVADCGRISSGSPVAPLLEASSLVGVVIRPHRENFRLSATAMTELADAATDGIAFGWVLVGPCPWPVHEVIEQYGWPVWCTLPEDPASAEAVAGRRRLRRRSPLARSVQSFADDIAKHLALTAPAPLPAVPAGDGSATPDAVEGPIPPPPLPAVPAVPDPFASASEPSGELPPLTHVEVEPTSPLADPRPLDLGTLRGPDVTDRSISGGWQAPPPGGRSAAGPESLVHDDVTVTADVPATDDATVATEDGDAGDTTGVDLVGPVPPWVSESGSGVAVEGAADPVGPVPPWAGESAPAASTAEGLAEERFGWSAEAGPNGDAAPGTGVEVDVEPTDADIDPEDDAHRWPEPVASGPVTAPRGEGR